MASWSEIERDAPEVAAAAKAYLDAHVHKTLATLRVDGSPRVSGVEITFALGEVWLGSMPGALKGRDLRRDPRFALHSGSDDPPTDDGGGWTGDAKLSGVAVDATDDPAAVEQFLVEFTKAHPEGDGDDPFDLFRLDVRELTTVSLGEPADHLLIESWHQGRGVTTAKR